MFFSGLLKHLKFLVQMMFDKHHTTGKNDVPSVDIICTCNIRTQYYEQTMFEVDSCTEHRFLSVCFLEAGDRCLP